MESSADLLVGIDVHKAEVVVVIGQERPRRVKRTWSQLEAFAAELAARDVALVLLEPSGGYEQLVIDVLLAAEVPVTRVNPQTVRWFARGAGVAAKSDALDARVLVQYGQAHGDALPRLEPLSAAQRDLQALGRLRRTLRDDRVAKQQQRDEQPVIVQAVLTEVIADLDQALARVEAQILALITETEQLAHQAEILTSCPGVGMTTAVLLVSELPELGQRSGKEIARLVGVAPLTQQSGRTLDTAHISGGRAHVRREVWMAAVTAQHHNPAMRAFAERLVAAGKPRKAVTVACMRKLLTILNTLLARDECWRDVTGAKMTVAA